MTPTRVQQLRRRIAAARAEDEAERGSVLVYVLIVTMLVTTAVTALVMTTTQAITPTRDSVNRTAAYAAAQAGIQDALAYVNTQCPTYGARCDSALSQSQTNQKTSGNVLAGSSESFSWKIGSSYVTDSAYNRYLRITSVGSSNGRSVALAADVDAVPNPLDYEYYTTYETNGTADISALNPQRTISIDCSSVAAAASSLSFGCPSGTASAVWKGSSDSSGASPTVCDRLWYDSPVYDADGAGRSSVEASQALTPGTDWQETGSAGGKTLTRDVPCQVAFTSGQTFNGKVYTVDAPLISNGTPGNSTGPVFAGGLTTAWQSTSNPSAPNTNYRSDPYVGGAIASNAVSQSNPLSFSNTFSPTPSASSCIFYGPTRVKLNGDGTATVTSPQTPAKVSATSGCYTAAPTGIAGQYLVDYKSFGDGVIYVKNNGTKPSTGYPSTGQKTGATPTEGTAGSAGNTVFYLKSAAGSGSLDSSAATASNSCNTSATYTGTNASTSCAWSDASSTTPGTSWTADGTGWTKFSAGTTCTTDAKDELTFLCEFNGGSYGPDGYKNYRQRVTDDLNNTSYSCSGSSFTPATATSAQLACLLNAELKYANTGSQVAGFAATNGAHQYFATAGTPTVKTSTQAASNASTSSAPITGDSLFEQKSGSAATETVTTTATTFTVSRQVGSCYGLLGVVSCLLGTPQWGDGTTNGASVPQFQVTITQKTYSNLTGGAPAVSYFPSMSDVTQYGTGTNGANGNNGPGDVYIEGSNTAPLSVLADDDAIVTGNLTTSGSGATLLDTLGDIRIYNPMSCAQPSGMSTSAWTSQIANTTAGFCPNDLTGLYTGGLVSGSTLSSAHPAKQYTNMLSTPVSEIDAALVAQGSSNSSGSIRTDNVDRGTSNGTLTVKGGMYQRHRGSLGVQWEYLSTGTGSRAGSGYKVEMTYNDLQSSGLTYVPTFQGGSVTRYWNVVSASTCTKVSSGVCVGSGS